MNLRAICPNCGGKIHTQPKGLGHFTWARSWFLVQTGTTCQHCGVALSGKVKADNKAELASEAQLRTRKKAAKTAARQQRRVAKEATARHAAAVADTPMFGLWLRTRATGRGLGALSSLWGVVLGMNVDLTYGKTLLRSAGSRHNGRCLSHCAAVGKRSSSMWKRGRGRETPCSGRHGASRLRNRSSGGQDRVRRNPCSRRRSPSALPCRGLSLLCRSGRDGGQLPPRRRMGLSIDPADGSPRRMARPP